MTAEQIIKTLKNAPVNEHGNTSILSAWNNKEAWAFHAVQWGDQRRYGITQILPYFSASIHIEDIPFNIDEMTVMWADKMNEKYSGGIKQAMAEFSKSK